MNQEFVSSLMQVGGVWVSLLGVAVQLYWFLALALVVAVTAASCLRAYAAGASLKRAARNGFLLGAGVSFALLNIAVAHQLLTHFAV